MSSFRDFEELAEFINDIEYNIEVEDEEEDLFEIDLEFVNKIPPTHYLESYVIATENALLANCLLPISDVSSAVPMAPNVRNRSLLSKTANVLMIMEPMPLGKLLRLPFFEDLCVEHEDMNANLRV